MTATAATGMKALEIVSYISVPLIILFLAFRKKIMEGVSRGGMKG